MKSQTVGIPPDLTRIDQKYIWHPFTQTQEWIEEEPVIIEKGEGPFLYDTGGKQYIDAVSSIWCNIHGHNHQHINKALVEQLSKVSHTTLLGLSNVPSIRLAEKLALLFPKGLKKFFYSDSGAGAVEAAIKIAVQFWHLQGKKRTQFLALEGAYHGDTFGSMSLGYSETFHKPFKEMLFQVYRAAPPYLYAKREKITEEEAEEKSLKEVEIILKSHAHEMAACIVEPLVQGAAGIWPHSPRYLKKLFNLVKSYGILFIADEVAVGFGRTGKMFAVEHANITPDILCLGKGLSGGYLPLSLTITTEEIFNEFKQFFHGHTFSGNPLACSAGIASLEVFEKENTLKKLETRIEMLWSFLKKSVEPHPHVMEMRGSGFFVGIEIGKSKDQNFPVDFRAGKKVMMAARKRGILFRPLLDTVVLVPQLNIPEEILNDLLRGVLESIEEAFH